MGLGQDSLTDEGLSLVGFEGNVSWAAGTINLPVIAKPHCTITHFHVLSGSSPYNAIMGRPWIHKIRAVPSTYHQCLRYPTPEGIMEIKGNQWTSRGCLISHLQNIKKKKTTECSNNQEKPSRMMIEDREEGSTRRMTRDLDWSLREGKHTLRK